MPELPEVETIVRDLHSRAQGSTIREVEVYRPDLIDGEPAEAFARGLQGCRIEGITRRAKNIVFHLGEDHLVVNLGMTGRLLVAGPGAPDPSHLGVRLGLDDGRAILYHDVRRFGRLQRFGPGMWWAREAQLGIEPLSPGFTPESLYELTRRSRSPIKSWLMDQQRVVGVGNIYASEALFRAAIDPRRPAHSLRPAEATRLHATIRAVLEEAIDFRGTTLLDYRDPQGETGGFAAQLRVYDREGLPCTACRTPIRRLVQGGRSTFFCPACQR